MALTLITAPTVEPVSLTELKAHLRIDSGTLADNLTMVQSIAPGAHVIAAAYSLLGTGVDVLGYNALVVMEAGTNGAGGTVDVKLQESDDNLTFTDVTSGAFTQVTTANDNATYELAYSGTKQYLRAVATVAVATCDFAVTVIKQAPISAEDTLLEAMITSAREDCEAFQNRAYVTQTWELWLDAFPSVDHIDIPLPPLQSITSVKYYGTDNTEYTMDAADYFVDTKSEPGRVSLAYGETWPTTTLRPANGVVVRFVCGYGLAAAVPKPVKQAIMLYCGDFYENREAFLSDRIKPNPAAERLLWKNRIVNF